MIHSKLDAWDVTNKRVLLRTDFNIPLKDGQIIDDFRLRIAKPTIDYLYQKKARIIIITHMARPKKFDPHYSTKILLPWFEKQGYVIHFAPTIEQAYALSQEKAGIIMLENLRFFPQEQTPTPSFAQKLACLGDYYVNDALSVCHRNDTSISLLPACFPSDKRTIGKLFEKEFAILWMLKNSPAHPFCLVMGGAKITDKIPLIKHLLAHVDVILLCPALVFSFLYAQGKPTGKSLIDTTLKQACQEIISAAQEQKKQLIFPVDYQVACNTIDSPLSIISSADDFPPQAIGISLGPKSAQLFAQEIMKSKTILLNGPCGFIERTETLQSMNVLLDAMKKTPGRAIIAGGDSLAYAHALAKDKIMDSLISSGGAALAYLSGHVLPGLRALNIA
jgi:3-phosphoglycerate kinase